MTYIKARHTKEELADIATEYTEFADRATRSADQFVAEGHQLPADRRYRAAQEFREIAAAAATGDPDHFESVINGW